MKLAIFFVVFSIIIFLAGGLMHEQVHVQIYAGDGIDSRVEYHWGYFETIAEQGCRTETCRLSNNINEIVSYNLQFVTAIFIIFGFIVIAILERREK